MISDPCPDPHVIQWHSDDLEQASGGYYKPEQLKYYSVIRCPLNGNIKFWISVWNAFGL